MFCSLIKDLKGEEYSYNKWKYCKIGNDLIYGLFQKLISARYVVRVLLTFNFKYLVHILIDDTVKILLKSTPGRGIDALIVFEY